MKKYLFLIIILCSMFYCSLDVTGTNDETSSGIALYKPDGNPAVGAIVRFYTVGDTSKQYIYQTMTDDSGKYLVEGVTSSSGTYNVWAQLGDSLVAMQDSVFISSVTNFVKDDTLGKPGSISGIVGLQPGHDPRTVTVQAVGTHIYSNVNAEGRFILNGMAGGEYTLRLSTTLPEYTDTFCNVIAFSDIADTIADTLWLIYTGIPIVTGMFLTYDTLNGVVTLTWNKTNYSNFQDYLIYRDFFDLINPSPTPIASSIDTLFRDTIFQGSIIDPNDYHFKYRIKIRNNLLIIGNSFKFLDVIAVSPEKVKTTFDFTTKHISTGLLTDSASINDSIQLKAFITNPTRAIKKVSWAVGHIDSIKQVKIFDPLDIQYSDTLIYLWNSIGNYPIYSIVEDDAGTVWIDTTICYIVTDAPIPSASTTTPRVSINDSIRLQGTATDVYGTIVKWEWKFGDNAWVITSSGDTTVFVPLTELQVYVCSLRVTDDDGIVNVDCVLIEVMGTITDIDGNVYHTIKIGNQVWTVENLRTTKYNDGNAIPNVADSVEWYNLDTGAYCYYNNDGNNKEKYGALYNWYAVNTGKLAPVGWHVPTHAEWTELEYYLIANGYNWDGTTTENKVGKSMAAKTDWNSSDQIGDVGNDPSTNNSSGFSALPGGSRGSHGKFGNQGNYAYWWTSSLGWAFPYYRFLIYDRDLLMTEEIDPGSRGYSVRLVRDN